MVRDADFPLLSAGELGDSEEGTEFWGHVNPGLFSLLSGTEIWFQCQTSGHNRIINFKTDSQECLDYFSTGAGSCSTLATESVLYDDHTGRLPASQNGFEVDLGDLAMTDRPFRSGNARWSAGYEAGNDREWECDNLPRDADLDTLHRIWVR